VFDLEATEAAVDGFLVLSSNKAAHDTGFGIGAGFSLEDGTGEAVVTGAAV